MVFSAAFLVSSLALGAFGLGDFAQPAPTKWALLVGVDDYESPDLTDLKYAVKDIRAVSDELVRSVEFKKEHVFVMSSDLGRDDRLYPDNANVVDQLDGLAARMKPGDTFLFMFSGHGFLRDGAHYLATANCKIGSLTALQLSSLPLQLLKSQMARVRADKLWFVIDACRNDPEAGKGDGDNLLSQAFSKDLRIVADSGAGVTSSAVLFACSEGERAYEWPEKQHGVFTYYLLEALRGKAADSNGELSVGGIGQYVQDQVAKWSEAELASRNRRQRPWLLQEGAARIVLARAVPTPVSGQTPVATVELKAYLRVLMEPAGADVSVDGKPTGKQTPCTLVFELTEGPEREFEIVLSAPGFAPSGIRFKLRRGDRQDLTGRMTPRAASEKDPPGPRNLSARQKEIAKKLSVFLAESPTLFAKFKGPRGQPAFGGETFDCTYSFPSLGDRHEMYDFGRAVGCEFVARARSMIEAQRLFADYAAAAKLTLSGWKVAHDAPRHFAAEGPDGTSVTVRVAYSTDTWRVELQIERKR